MKHLLLIPAFLACFVPAVFSALTPMGTLFLSSTFENIGIVVPLSNPTPADLRALDSAVVEYRAAGTSAWKKGHPLSIIANIPLDADYELYADSIDMFSAKGVPPDYRLAGSVLFLTPGTAYDIRVKLYTDSGASEFISGATSTRSYSFPAIGRDFYVDARAGDDANSGLSSAEAKQSFTALTDAGLLPGDKIHVANGAYYGGLLLDGIRGSSGNYIHFLAEGDSVVLEGSDETIAVTPGLWTPEGSDIHGYPCYSTRVPWITRGVFVDAPRRPGTQGVLYRYHPNNVASGGRSLADMLNDTTGLNAVGSFFQDTAAKKLYIILGGGAHPDSVTVHVGRQEAAVDVRNSNHVLFHGFKIAHGNEIGMAIRNCRNLVIRACRFEDSQSGIYMPLCENDALSYDCLIDSCDFSYNNAEKWMRLAADPWSAWQWQKMDEFENNGIDISQAGGGFVIRHNRFRSLFNALAMIQYMPNQQRYFDTVFYNNIDFCGNRFERVFDDAIEVEGSCINLRMYDNDITMTHMGFSDAVTTVGPVYFIRNTISYWSHYMNGGNAIKAKPLWYTLNDFAPCFLYHNTFYIGNANKSEWTFNCWNDFFDTYKNNIFVGGTGVWNLDKLIKENTKPLQLSMDYNSYYTNSGSGVYLNYRNTLPTCAADTCMQKRGFELNGLFHEPGQTSPFFSTDTVFPNLRLTSFSTEIDKGLFIPGVNDSFAGVGPDMGAIEAFDLIRVETAVSEPGEPMGIIAVPNPFNPETRIYLKGFARISQADMTLSITDVAGREVKRLRAPETAENGCIRMTGTDNLGKPLASGIYLVSVSTGKTRFTTRVVLAR